MVLDSFITAALTVIIGVMVYALSQIVSKFFIEPIHRLDEMRGEIADSLEFYANIYTNPGLVTPKEMKEASTILRQKATLLRSRAYIIRWNGFFSRIKIIPKVENIDKAVGNLIALSNSIFKGNALQNHEWAEEIKKLLNLR